MKALYLLLLIVLQTCFSLADGSDCIRYYSSNKIGSVKYSDLHNMYFGFNGNELKIIDKRNHIIKKIYPKDSKGIIAMNYSELNDELVFISNSAEQEKYYINFYYPTTEEIKTIPFTIKSNKLVSIGITFNNDFLCCVDLEKQLYVFDIQTGNLLKFIEKGGMYWANRIYLDSKSNTLLGVQDTNAFSFDINSLEIINYFRTPINSGAHYFFPYQDSIVVHYDSHGYIHYLNYISGEHISYYELKKIYPYTNEIKSINDSLWLINSGRTVAIVDIKNEKKKKEIFMNQFGSFVSASVINKEGRKNILLSSYEISTYDIEKDIISSDVFDEVTIPNTHYSGFDISDNFFFHYITDSEFGEYYPHNKYMLEDANSCNNVFAYSYDTNNIKIIRAYLEDNEIVIQKDNSIVFEDIYSHEVKQEYSFDEEILYVKISDDKLMCYYSLTGDKHYLYSLASERIIFESVGSYPYEFSPKSTMFIKAQWEDNSVLELRNCIDGSLRKEFKYDETSSSIGSVFSDDEKYLFDKRKINGQKYYVIYDIVNDRYIDTIPFQENWIGHRTYVYSESGLLATSTYDGKIVFYDYINDMIYREVTVNNLQDVISDFKISSDKTKLGVKFMDGSVVWQDINGILSKEESQHSLETCLSISPNPASDYIEIKLNNVIPAQAGIHDLNIMLFDVLGEVVLTHPPTPSQEVELSRIDISSLNPGVYFVKVGSKVSKFIKM